MNMLQFDLKYVVFDKKHLILIIFGFFQSLVRKLTIKESYAFNYRQNDDTGELVQKQKSYNESKQGVQEQDCQHQTYLLSQYCRLLSRRVSRISISTEDKFKIQIKQLYDKEVLKYAIGRSDNVWFVNSCINEIYFIHKASKLRFDLFYYIRLNGKNYIFQGSKKQLLEKMTFNGILLDNCPAFDVNYTQDIICWLCCEIFISWEQFYVHNCQNHQNSIINTIQGHLQIWEL